MPDKEKEEESTGFKVTDRRPFTADGRRRIEVGPEVEKAPAQAETPASQPPSSGPEAAGGRPPRQHPPSAAKPEAPVGGAPNQHGPATLEDLILSLATTAMFQLGLVRTPGEEPPPTDLPAAKETIGLLEILEQKTKGNLTAEEEGLLTGSLYRLRLAFVELSGKTGRSR